MTTSENEDNEVVKPANRKMMNYEMILEHVSITWATVSLFGVVKATESEFKR